MALIIIKISAAIVIALLLDRLFSEPRRFHPLVMFGQFASAVEKRFYGRSDAKSAPAAPMTMRVRGIVAFAVTTLPFVAVALLLDVLLERLVQASLFWYCLDIGVSGVILYLAIGWQSLLSHAHHIMTPLLANDVNRARAALGMIVSRDTTSLEATDISKAATESVLENGADAIFSAIFWFCLLGIPGVVFYRMANTLDAMWGYKNARYQYFGWCAARVDDVLNFIPARLTALSYSVLGNTKQALACWQTQGNHWKSPNAGPVMAAGAGALNVSLGGAAVYDGKTHARPVLGPLPDEHTQANAFSIKQACRLINLTLLLWVGILIAVSIVAGAASVASTEWFLS